MNSIGGEIPLNILNNFPIEYKKIEKLQNFLFYDSGRSALNEILSDKIIKQKKFLLPIFSCESVIKPFIDNEVTVGFYDIEINFEINFDSIKNKVISGNFNAILIIDYFGIVNNSVIVDKLKDIDLFVIEDISHISIIPIILEKYSTKSDIIFGSLRKTLPVADGGVILKNDNYHFSDFPTMETEHSLLKAGSKLLRELYKFTDNENLKLESTFLELSKNAEILLDNAKPNDIYGISKLSMNNVSKINDNRIYQARRSNYSTLYNLFLENNLGYLLCPNIDISNDIALLPYFFPIYIPNNKQIEVRNTLLSKNIFAAIIWQLNIQDKKLFPNSTYISNNILCLPIDQRYNQNQMIYLFNNLKVCIK